uniref:Uncharacterized protein n=1 Tax=Peronospora matthiolae TaxID=2874970 RepID=A0AAV1UU67_9STRA
MTVEHHDDEKLDNNELCLVQAKGQVSLRSVCCKGEAVPRRRANHELLLKKVNERTSGRYTEATMGDDLDIDVWLRLSVDCPFDRDVSYIPPV